MRPTTDELQGMMDSLLPITPMISTKIGGFYNEGILIEPGKEPSDHHPPPDSLAGH